MVEGVGPGHHGDIDTAFVHFDERAGLRRITLSINGEDCKRLAQRSSDLGIERFFLSNTTIES